MINKTDNICFMQDKFQRVTDKNNVGNTNVLTISAQHGLINQFEYYNHQYASENTSGYTLLHKGDFAYNKSYSDGYPWGATKRLERYDSGVVSPLYICFAAKDGVCADFYSYYFESEPFYREIYKIAQEGARNHGLLNVSTEDFFKISIANPPLEEQRRIAEILGCCDRVIALKKELIAEKKKQKKALMQKLLNPDSGFRLPGFSGKWKSQKLGTICNTFSGGTPDRSHPEYFNGTIPWIKSGELNTRLITDAEEYISEQALENSSAKMVDADTLLIAMYGATAGVIAITKIKAAINQAILSIVHDNSIDKVFLMYSLQIQIDLAISKYTQGGQPNFNAAIIKSLPINVPNLDEQQAIADILSAADKEIDLLEQELAQQEQKKKSLMQLLLTGIIRV